MKNVNAVCLWTILLVLLIAINGCNKVQSFVSSSFPPANFAQTVEEKDFTLRLEMASKITAVVMSNSKIFSEFSESIKKRLNKQYNSDEAFTFKEIIEEKDPYVKGFAYDYKKSFYEVFMANGFPDANKFQYLHDKTKNQLDSISKTHGFSVNNTKQIVPFDDIRTPVPVIDTMWNSLLTQLLQVNTRSSDEAQIYFPYSENFNISASSNTPITSSYYPGFDADVWAGTKVAKMGTRTFTNLGYRYTYNRINVMCDENYIQSNPTLVINLGNGVIGLDSLNIPPPIACADLSSNINGDRIDDNYHVTTVIPKMKLTRNYRTWVGGSNYVKLYQFYSVQGANTDLSNTDPSKVVSSSYRIISPNDGKLNAWRIRRKKVKNGDWLDVNIVFNPDWKLVQYDNLFVVSYNKAGGGDDLTVTTTAGITYDTASKTFKPSYSNTASSTIKINSQNRWFFDAPQEIVTRRDMFAHMVGDNFGFGTTQSVGLNTSSPYTIRKTGSFNYYFKTTLCY